MSNLKIFISELCITEEPLSIEIADKLLRYHIWPMNKVRHILNQPIWASEKSGYRPKAYELKKGRSGNSEHTFEGKGAVDWTTKKGYLIALLNLIFQYTNYTRVCYYPSRGFIHCDHKPTPQGQRQFFIAKGNKWQFQRVFTKNYRYNG